MHDINGMAVKINFPKRKYFRYEKKHEREKKNELKFKFKFSCK